MEYIVVIILLVLILILYFFYKSYYFQFFLHKNKIKKSFLNEFKKTTKGRFIDVAYFAPSHQIISKHEYNSITNKQKVNFSKCYNVIIFKTPTIKWELFFFLIKEGVGFTEIFNIRVFPTDTNIKSQGNIEKTYGRINVFTNNHYLTKMLETTVSNYVTWLMRYDGDMLLISSHDLHFKAFVNPKKISVNRAMDMVKALHGIKKNIYKKDTLEY